MENVLFGAKKNVYKGNMHCHSTLSDGCLTPQELKDNYKSRGYSFLAITDHEFLNNNSYLDDKDFITITSCEIAIKEFPNKSTLKNYDMKVCHLNFYAKEQNNDYNFFYNCVADHFSSPEQKAKLNKPSVELERVYGADGINELIKSANENGFFVAYNHPRWSLENYREYSKYEGLWGVEIFNTSCNKAGIYEYNLNVHDDFLRDGKRIFVSSGDDNHNYKDDSFGTAVMVEAEYLEYSQIIDSLLNGNFYTTTGPVIEKISKNGDNVTVVCSNARNICYSTHGRRAMSITASDGEYLNSATFEIKETDIYFRISVVDEYGRRADSQAYFLDEI